ncbi:MAG TPA: sigma-70 family RNA polymerase sigma factor [Pyrinomonadaceae bacterium]|jgi:RNA polymerase sigma factor (sigma-70 family)
MKLEIESYFEPDISWLGEINRRALKLENLISVFPASTSRLICTLWHGVNSNSGITLTLAVAGRELVARGENSSPVMATREAFEKLSRKVNGLIEEFRAEGFWHRTSRDRFARAETLRKETITTGSEAAASIDRELSELYNFVRREIAMAQAQGDLKPGDLSVAEIVDEVALMALQQYEERPPELNFRPWLLQLALDVIKCRKRETERHSKVLTSVETPELHTERPEVEDEIYDYYQPDSEVRLKDLIPDGRLPTPEETLTELEFQQHINRALAQLPRRWREAFILYSVEGLTLEEVARVTRQPVDATHRAIELARELLRTHLAEVGIRAAERELRREVIAS